jgi:hypothetical protein
MQWFAHMPVVLMLFFFLYLTLVLLIGSTGFGFPAAMFAVGTIIATVALLKAARMLDQD